MFRFLCYFLTIVTIHTQAKQPIISGFIDSHPSTFLKQERRFMVDLPENYYDNSLAYPTLYVIDGDFQFQHVSAIAKNLARMGKVPPMIVVGIALQGNADYVYRTTWPIKGERDYGGAQGFYQYIKNELVPHIDSQYRTNNNRIISGYSLGGLFTTYAMVQEHPPFNAFIAMSPSYWFDDYSAEQNIANLIAEKFTKNKTPPAPLFLSIANEQGMGVDKVYNALTTLNIKNWQITFEKYPEENHFSTALPALHDGLAFLFNDFYEDGYELQAHKTVEDVFSTFEKKKQNYNGFRVEWLQAYKFAKYVFGSKQTEKIDQILDKIEKEFPDSLVNITNYLAKGLNTTGQYEKAKEILERIKAQGKSTALWHHQYSLALKGVEQPKLAEQAQNKAMALAKEQKLPMWQIWEMK